MFSKRLKLFFGILSISIITFILMIFVIYNIKNIFLSLAFVIPLMIGANIFIYIQKCPSCGEPVFPRVAGILPLALWIPKKCSHCSTDFSKVR